MIEWFKAFRARTEGNFVRNAVIVMFILIQLGVVFALQIRVIIDTDGIFSYTLANNPYAYNFFEANYDEFPDNNGWIDAHILKEHYVVEEYDRFNYSSVYYHQRHDVHPPLYYFAVHTFSSLFPGKFSNLHTMMVNLLALLLVDVLLIKLFVLLYGRAEYAIAPFLFLTLMNIMQYLFTLARMYMLLFLFCTWYIYIHAYLSKSEEWKKRDLVKMICCIFLGTLTHYYFYVYAAVLSFLFMIFLCYKKSRYKLFNYIYSGVTGIALSWIFYPWIMWHIFDNPQQKHTNMIPWSIEKIQSYFGHLNQNLFNGRIWIFILVVVVLYFAAAISGKTAQENRWQCSFGRMVLGSGVIFSLVIFTLDQGEGILYYWTAFYTAFIVGVSVLLLNLFQRIKLFSGKNVRVFLAMAVCIGIVYSMSTIEVYISNARTVITRAARHESFRDGFYRVSEDFVGHDCIYIDKSEALFVDCLFEFGEYGTFKRILLEDFEQYGIDEETLTGRGNPDKSVIVYAPAEVSFGSEYRLLVSESTYNVFELEGREEE